MLRHCFCVDHSIIASDPCSRAAAGKQHPTWFWATLLSGTPVKASDWRRQVVVVSFWASWCSPAAKELPSSRA